MFGCMVVLPVFAIFGTSWLDFGNSKKTHARQPLRVAGAMQQPRSDGSFAAAGFGPASLPVDQRQPQPNSAATAAPTPFAVSPSAPPPAMAPTPPSMPAAEPGRTLPARNGSRGIPQRQRPPAANPATASAMPDAAIPANYLAMADESGATPSSVAQTSAVAGLGDWFTSSQQRLRELGATYYLLESWGRRGELYRFHCKVAIAGNPDYTRHFEATDAEPARAMESVLREVEAWRSTR